MPAWFPPCSMCNVSWHGRRKFLPLNHSFSQPMKPLVECLSLECATTFLRINLKFLPRSKDGTAKKIINQIKCDFAAKHHHPKGFPSDRNQVNCVFAVRSEHFAYFLCVRPIRQRLHAPKRTSEGRALERSHQLEHCFPSSPLTVITDLRSSKDYTCSDSNCIDQICKRAEVHIQRGSVTRPRNRHTPLGTC